MFTKMTIINQVEVAVDRWQLTLLVEIAIALTPFEGLCEFRPANEIADQLRRTPELCAVIGSRSAQQLMAPHGDNYRDTVALLREALRTLLHAPAATVQASVDALSARLKHDNEAQQEPRSALLLRLATDYPVNESVTLS
jgi:mannose-6-phosphate isomerase